MRVLNILPRLIDRISVGFAIPALALTMVLVLLVLIDVVARNVFTIGLIDTVTVGTTILLVVVFFGAAYTHREGKHIAIGLLREHLGEITRVWLRILSGTISIIILGILSWFAWGLAWYSYSLGWKLISPLAIPIGLLQGVIAAGFSLIVLQQLGMLLRDIACISSRAPEE